MQDSNNSNNSTQNTESISKDSKDSINTPKKQDIQNVDMSFLVKDDFTKEEYEQACYKVYYKGAWNGKRIGYDKSKIESQAKNKVIESIKENLTKQYTSGSVTIEYGDSSTTKDLQTYIQEQIQTFLDSINPQNSENNTQSQYTNMYYDLVNQYTLDNYTNFLNDPNTKKISEVSVEIRLIQGRKLLAKYPIPLPDLNAESSIILLEEEQLEIAFKMTEALYFQLYIDLCKEEDIQEIGETGSQTLQYTSAAVNIGLEIALAVLGGVNVVPGFGQIVSAIGYATLIITAAVDFIKQKAKTYPKSIENIRKIITLWIHYAKISGPNKKILMDGVEHYIHMQKAEYNDYMHPEGYTILNSAMVEYIIFQMLPQFRKMLLKLARRGGSAQGMQVMDSYPQAAGKDTTNEIDFALCPQKDTQEEHERKTSDSESKGKILDSMRGRDNADKPSCEKYDYEYSKVNFDIKLEKAQEINLLPIHAHNTAVAQTLKSFVLQLCSLHYAKFYLENDLIAPFAYIVGANFNPTFSDYKGQKYSLYNLPAKPSGWEKAKIIMLIDDFARIESNVPTDMKEAEINPHIKKFNTESSFNAIKQQQKRYLQGFNPTIIHEVKLDLIDESVEKYYTIYTALHAQLKNKDFFDFIEYKNGKLILNRYVKVTKEIMIYNLDSKEIYKFHSTRTETTDKDDPDAYEVYDDYFDEYYYERAVNVYQKTKQILQDFSDTYFENLAKDKIDSITNKDIIKAAFGTSANYSGDLGISNVEYLKTEHTKGLRYEYISQNNIIQSNLGILSLLYRVTIIDGERDKGYLQNEISNLRIQLAKEGVLSHGGKETEDKNLDKLTNAGYI